MIRIEEGESMGQATLCFLTRNNEVLLGMKKRAFAEGKWNGYGGKQKEGETILETAVREFQEEAEITPRSLIQSAVIDCHHPNWSQRVVVYVGTGGGTPVETEEMRPRWFP